MKTIPAMILALCMLFAATPAAAASADWYLQRASHEIVRAQKLMRSPRKAERYLRNAVRDVRHAIDAGVRSGALSPAEATRLRHKVRSVQRLLAKYKRGGLTRGELRRLVKKFRTLRAHIRRDLHDAERAPPKNNEPPAVSPAPAPVPIVGSLPASVLSSPAPSAVAQRLLAAHNRERAAARVPPLAWSLPLANAAAAHAAKLATIGHLEHSRPGLRVGVRESTWMGTRGAYTPEQMVGDLASEKAQFRPGIFPNVSSTGNWADVAHYTQIIWPGTTRVGCGIAEGRTQDFLVCHYAPKGNIDGQNVP